MDYYSLDNYFYNLPDELIAKEPVTPRDSCKLMLIERKTGSIKHLMFRDLVDLLEAGDSLVFNNTKVIPARLIGTRPQGGKAEIFLTRRITEDTWEALVKPGKKIQVGSKVLFDPSFYCEVLEILANGNRIIKLYAETSIEEALNKFGHVPLPPYMKREDSSDDKINYQTVYADIAGSVAAPTAGLHFTNEMLSLLSQKGITQNSVTLHVGLGTFLPVKTDDIREHTMHHEQFSISEKTANQINNRNQTKKQICVGTTTCRTLESATTDKLVVPGNYDTNIFIYPGYEFKQVTELLTNFHQPGSSLLMLVSAFASYELIQEAYAKAVEEKYRFLSYGDAMLII